MTDDPRPTGQAWAIVSDLFHRALLEPAGQRAAWLDGACGGDAALRTEVASLLAAHDRADQFLESRESLAGRALGHYQIQRLLGEGGMGVVYLAEDTRLHRLVALKALAPRFVGDEVRRERLRREARAAAALTDPGIATVYALEEFDDHLYLACEYVEGETLRDELRRGPLPMGRAVDTARAMARALAAAHDRGTVHRDLKPENVMRATDGRVKILDFGIARFRDAPASHPSLTDDGAVLGTPAYMAPEQIRGEPVDARADIFAFGIVCYEALTGVHPFAEPAPVSTLAKILEADPAPLADRRPAGASRGEWEAIADIVHTCLQKAPADRFASTADVVRALERWPAASQSRRSTPAAQWWWQFHQAAVSVTYAAGLIPLAYARASGDAALGLGVCVAGLVATLVAITLRLHLWFTLRSYPAEWDTQRRRTSAWIRLADVTLAGAQLLAAAIVLPAHEHLATMLVALGVAELLACLVIEPATTRAAFGDRSGPASS